MARIHVFADESGNFDFSANPKASKFFILTTVTFFDDRQACHDLNQLRFDLAWDGVDHPGPFHASEELQAVRDRVFEVLQPHGFRVDATIFEKRKTQPQLHVTEERFYQYAWFYHMKYLAPRIANASDEVLIVAASIGVKRKQAAFHRGVRDVMNQVAGAATMKTTYWPAATEAGLQIADYCSWAMQRRWEMRDSRSFDLISDRVRSEFNIFSQGRVMYY